MRPGALTPSIELLWDAEGLDSLYGHVFRGDVGWESMEDFGKVYGGRGSVSGCDMARRASGDMEKDLRMLLFVDDAEVKLPFTDVAQDEAEEVMRES